MQILPIQAIPRLRPPVKPFLTGTSSGPGRPTISVDDLSLCRNGERWLGVMGEIHYARLDPSQWETALARMKAGGLDVIASYVFWIHHEEVEGAFDFAGRRDLRRFVETCAKLDLPIIVRCGPWCHGEVRNGGLPDWILGREFEPRSLDPKFLAYARRLYEQIELQLRGLLWKDGGPVIGIQVDNEFGGPGEYLIELKRIACEVGLDVPIYTRTGWPSTSTPIPFGELLPLFGAYAEGFWERSLESMPGHYWKAFCFENLRTDVQVGMDQLGERAAQDENDTPQYPYLTCELGGGMEMSYHRRIKIEPIDILSVAITKVGSGSNLPGYYMYHGGVNPRGLTTLHESQATKYWNDVPIKSYDFQAPLGSFGQVRLTYHLLRRLHLFLNDFGPLLAPMSTCLPEKLPQNKHDTQTLRHSVRTDGKRGFLFVNNYQRSTPIPEKPDVQFAIALHDGSKLLLPTSPITIPADSTFIWPFNLDVGIATIVHATAQLVCRLQDGTTEYLFFSETMPGETEFVMKCPESTQLDTAGKRVELSEGHLLIQNTPAAVSPAIELTETAGRSVRIILLDAATSRKLWKFTIAGKEHVIISEASLHLNAVGELCATAEGSVDDANLSILPAPSSIACNGTLISSSSSGAFASYPLPWAIKPRENVSIQLDRHAGPLREIETGFANVAEAPADDAFLNAEHYRLKLPGDLDGNCLLRIHYIGDVARVLHNGELILDNFYNGNAFDIGLDLLPHGATEIQLQILPLQKDAPIFLADGARPNFGDASARVTLAAVRLVRRATIRLKIMS